MHGRMKESEHVCGVVTLENVTSEADAASSSGHCVSREGQDLLLRGKWSAGGKDWHGMYGVNDAAEGVNCPGVLSLDDIGTELHRDSRRMDHEV